MGSLRLCGGGARTFAARASPVSIRSPTRLASAAQPSTFPALPKKCRRVSSSAHSAFMPSAMGRSMMVGPLSGSVHSGCCFTAFLLSLLVQRLIQVQYFAHHHGPRGEFRRWNCRIARLFPDRNQVASCSGIGRVVLLHLAQRLLQHRCHLRRWVMGKHQLAEILDSLLRLLSTLLRSGVAASARDASTH